jgi:hypothetical protein
MTKQHKVHRSKVAYYKVATNIHVRGTTTNSHAEALRIKKEKGSAYSVYYTDSKGYWAKEYLP